MPLRYQAGRMWSLLGILLGTVVRHIVVSKGMCLFISPTENTNRNTSIPAASEIFLILPISLGDSSLQTIAIGLHDSGKETPHHIFEPGKIW